MLDYRNYQYLGNEAKLLLNSSENNFEEIEMRDLFFFIDGRKRMVVFKGE